MKHDDEHRSDAEIEALIREEAVSDPYALYAAVEDLNRELDAVRAELAQTRSDLAAAEKATRWQKAKRKENGEALQAATKEQKALTSKLGETHAKLEAYRKESRRLREDLERVRGSRTFKVGKAVLSPTRLFRGGGSTGAAAVAELPAGSGSAEQTSSAPAERTATVDTTAAESAPADDGAPSTPYQKPSFEGESTLPVSLRDLDTLHHEFEIHPTSETLYRAVNRSWHGHGMIEAPAAFLRENPALVAQLDDRKRLIAERVLGDQRLQESGIPVPPRAEGSVFLPEPDRVMYCVHSTPVFNSNGYSTRTRGVAKGFQAAGADIKVVARAGYPWDHRTDGTKPAVERTVRELDDVQYIHLPGSGLGKVPMDHYLIEAADAFTREALVQRPEIIQSASNYRTALPALIAARRVGVPFVYEVRGFWELSQAAATSGWESSEQYRTIHDLETLVAQEADAVLAITRQVKDDLIGRGVPGDKIRVAPNAVDTLEFAPLPKDSRYAERRKIRTDVPVIGFAGSMVGYEGLDLLLEASGRLTERGVDHQIVIAGSGAEEKNLRELRDHIRGCRALFLGRLPMEEMPRLLSTFDIVPLPRLPLAVTEMVSPLKPLEAFASQKAVLMSDVAPHRDLAGENEERALLFRAGDVESLADQLETLIADEDLRRDLGRTARLWTLDERTWTSVATSMRASHSALLAPSGGITQTSTAEHRAIGSITIGLIADEFTTKTISASMPVVPLDRAHWREQLDESGLDLVLVESAWEGNGGQWHRGIGAYEPEEHRDIRELLARARELGIPTAFWNKEDPIHIKRFRPTAALCDHVFTTDATMIPTYLSTPGAITRTASAMPFYAQPVIHNPLPTERPYRHTVAYAGTYYGDRYKERSEVLYRMLEASSRYGLTIYDRQATNPDSPYRFPEEFEQFSDGALPYDEVIDSYKSHLAHLNGNSVLQSPSMFSRRVVEIAACGGIALSGPGRGVEETFGGLIPVSREAREWRALLHSWSTDPVARVREAWRQMRAVHRSHTVQSAMTILLRTAGLPVSAAPLDTYAVVFTRSDDDLVAGVLAQSHRPLEVFVPGGASDATAPLESAGIRVLDSSAVSDATARWIGVLDAPAPRTWFEDLLLAPRFGDWTRIDVEIADETSEGRTLASYGAADGSSRGLVLARVARSYPTVGEALRASTGRAVRLLVASITDHHIDSPGIEKLLDAESHETSGPRTVVVAGHDLKFAGAVIEQLEAAGHSVLIDKWESHTKHDEERSEELLARADIVFCEWGLGNAVWYSKHVSTTQRLVVRVHSQELFRPYLSRVNHAKVDQYFFVGELIRRAAIESHGVPESKATVVPNSVDVPRLTLDKFSDSEKNLGLVGIVPRAKRLDLALDLLIRLLDRDPEYRLFIKGRRPEDYAWMSKRPEEMQWYAEQYRRIDDINAQHPGAIVFDPQGDDMPEWYRKIGVALSVSDFESFHLTIADGAASGALPASLAWAGSDYLYPRDWLSGTVEQMAISILDRRTAPRTEREEILDHYAASHVLPRLIELVAPRNS
ncbi:glycosyltransferase [Brachybacterium sp. DNPG3]